ncbi:MAG: hypothetical protein EOO15_20175 [Chitinophagaceae bacterium]|nr:MAG: hypothetical protein EOO15_20175 [Chitinophagaceae bacterium]
MLQKPLAIDASTVRSFLGVAFFGTRALRILAKSSANRHSGSQSGGIVSRPSGCLPFGGLLATVRRQSAARHRWLASCPSAVSASLRHAPAAHAHRKAIDDSTI